MRDAIAAVAVVLLWGLAGTPLEAGGGPGTSLAVSPAIAAGSMAAQASPPAKPAEPATPADPAKPADPARPAGPTSDPPDPSTTKGTYGGGFRLSTADGRFLVRFSAGVQVRYTYMTFDAAVLGNDTDYSNLMVRRARLWLDGHAYDPRFTYYLHVQLEPASAVNVHDAWLNYAIRPMVQVGAGRNKIAYGLEFLNSGFGGNFIDRSIFTGETEINSASPSRFPGGGNEGFPTAGENAHTGFSTGGLTLFRSQGVQLSGRNGDTGRVVEYQVGLWTGRDTRGASNTGIGHLVSARVGFHHNGFINWTSAGDVGHSPVLRTAVLLSAYADRNTRASNAAGQQVPRYDTREAGLNLAGMVRYRGLSVDLEFGHETYELADTTLAGDTEFDRQGWRAQAGYFVKPKVVEVVGRYVRVERLKDPSVSATRNSGLGFALIRDGTGVFREAVERDLRELTVGLNWYLSGAGHQHKLLVDYSRLARRFAGFVRGPAITGSVPDQRDDRIRAMLQFRF